MTRTVLVVGDANVDLVLCGDVVPRFAQEEQLIDAAELVLGGSASIVASGLARLEVPTVLAAVIGDDGFGAFVTERLRERGVQTDAVRSAAGAATGISVILSAPQDRAILTLTGAIPTLTADEVLTAARESGATWVHFASPFLIPALAGELPLVVGELRARGVGTSLDTNWDPLQRWDLVAGTVPLVDVLMPNRAELVALAGVLAPGAHDPAAGLAALGPRLVVKDGAAGGYSVDASGERVRAPGLRLDVVDTTGAGDSFDAGYLAAIAHDIEDETERLLWATTAGSLSTRAAGGTAAQATLAELRS